MLRHPKIGSADGRIHEGGSGYDNYYFFSSESSDRYIAADSSGCDQTECSADL